MWARLRKRRSNGEEPQNGPRNGICRRGQSSQTSGARYCSAAGFESPRRSLELLKALHILTRDGKLNQDSRRKLKQVYHLYQFIEPILQELGQGGQALTLADHGAGKSYLGFILYDLYFKAQAQGRIYGIETRAPLVRGLAEAGGRAGL